MSEKRDLSFAEIIWERIGYWYSKWIAKNVALKANRRPEMSLMGKLHEAMMKQAADIEKIVDHQANMESLWLADPTIHEAILQSALRHLHAVIEGDEETAKLAKKRYWYLESEL